LKNVEGGKARLSELSDHAQAGRLMKMSGKMMSCIFSVIAVLSALRADSGTALAFPHANSVLPSVLQGNSDRKTVIGSWEMYVSVDGIGNEFEGRWRSEIKGRWKGSRNEFAGALVMKRKRYPVSAPNRSSQEFWQIHTRLKFSHLQLPSLSSNPTSSVAGTDRGKVSFPTDEPTVRGRNFKTQQCRADGCSFQKSVAIPPTAVGG
jgi:hypothetical protein